MFIKIVQEMKPFTFHLNCFWNGSTSLIRTMSTYTAKEPRDSIFEWPPTWVKHCSREASPDCAVIEKAAWSDDSKEEEKKCFSKKIICKDSCPTVWSSPFFPNVFSHFLSLSFGDSLPSFGLVETWFQGYHWDSILSFVWSCLVGLEYLGVQAVLYRISHRSIITIFHFSITMNSTYVPEHLFLHNKGFKTIGVFAGCISLPLAHEFWCMSCVIRSENVFRLTFSFFSVSLAVLLVVFPKL